MANEHVDDNNKNDNNDDNDDDLIRKDVKM